MTFVGTLTPIDPTTEQVNYTFDYGDSLAPGETIRSATVTCVAIDGTDTQASSRLVAGYSIGPSPKTGAANAAVIQPVGTCLQGVVYQFQSVALTSAGQKLSCRFNLPCSTPPAAY